MFSRSTRNAISISIANYNTKNFQCVTLTLALKPVTSQGRCSRENCKYLHPPPHLKTQLEINGRNNLIQQKNMAMLAQQMQLANAMMPGTQLPPMVRGHTRMNTPQLLPTVRSHTCKSSHIYSSFIVCVALSRLSKTPSCQCVSLWKARSFVLFFATTDLLSFNFPSFILLCSSPCSR